MVKTRAELEIQLSSGGSAVEIERNFIKDLLDSLDLATEMAGNTTISDLQDQIDALSVRIDALENPA